MILFIIRHQLSLMKVVQRIAKSFLVHLRYPGKSVPEAIPHDRSESIDICVAKDCVEEMVLNMPKKDETSPRLRHIYVNLVERCRCQLKQILLTRFHQNKLLSCSA